MLAMLVAGCASFQQKPAIDYRTVEESPLRDREAAERQYSRGLRNLDNGNLPSAEQHFTNSLSADVTFAPAHVALGKVYYLQHRYYLAAWEFDYAQRLNPQRPEGHNNLGLVFEATGRLDEAVEQYALANSFEPGNFEYLGNFVRARYRNDDRSDDLRYFMKELVFLDPRPDWRAWAEQTLELANWEDESSLEPYPGAPYEELPSSSRSHAGPTLANPVMATPGSRRQ